MINNIGFACMSKRIDTKYKTLRLSNFTEQRWNECIMHNINETSKLIDYCIENNYKMVRLSSDIIPFATHEVTDQLDWMRKYHKEFQAIGKKIKDNSIRISLHPSQMCVINSNNPEVVKNSFKDLVYHSNIFNLMGVDGDILLHVGGVYDDKNAAMKRFIRSFKKLPIRVQNRLVIENDDKSYNINDVLIISKYTGIPVVLDIHHQYCTDCSMDVNLDRIFSTWNNRGRSPKIHLSSPRSDDKFRSHADFIDYEYYKDFMYKLHSIGYNVDIMVEAKQKDLAVIQLKHDLKII